MPHSFRGPLRERIRVELVEADLEAGFRLVDIVETEAGFGSRLRAVRALQDAEDVFSDIQQRLGHLEAPEKIPFEAIVGELRRAIDLARLHSS